MSKKQVKHAKNKWIFLMKIYCHKMMCYSKFFSSELWWPIVLPAYWNERVQATGLIGFTHGRIASHSNHPNMHWGWIPGRYHAQSRSILSRVSLQNISFLYKAGGSLCFGEWPYRESPKSQLHSHPPKYNCITCIIILYHIGP